MVLYGMKRKDYISWDELFIGIAELAAKRSKDPRSQHGCCIVDEDNRVVSVSYNGFPTGISDDEFPWDRGLKDDYVIHAEINASLMPQKIYGVVGYTCILLVGIFLVAMVVHKL